MSDLEAFGMTFTREEVELMVRAKSGGRSLAEIFSRPPFIADGIRDQQLIQAGGNAPVTITDERFTLIAAILERIATHINVGTLGGGSAPLRDTSAFTQEVTRLRELATTLVR